MSCSLYRYDTSDMDGEQDRIAAKCRQHDGVPFPETPPYPLTSAWLTYGPEVHCGSGGPSNDACLDNSDLARHSSDPVMAADKTVDTRRIEPK